MVVSLFGLMFKRTSIIASFSLRLVGAIFGEIITPDQWMQQFFEGLTRGPN
jgi:hypothetical protein